MKYTDMQRIKKILEYTEKLMQYVNEMKIDKDLLINNYAIQWTVTTPLYNIGEHAYYLSPEYKASHSEIKWHMISGLRHRLVHDYDDTNWNIIADVIFTDLPVLEKQLKEIVKKEDSAK